MAMIHVTANVTCNNVAVNDVSTRCTVLRFVCV